jgi:hypothetical protein
MLEIPQKISLSFGYFRVRGRPDNQRLMCPAQSFRGNKTKKTDVRDSVLTMTSDLTTKKCTTQTENN